MSKNKNQDNSNYQFPFNASIHLDFDMLYRHYFNFIVRDIFSIFLFDGLPVTVDDTFLKYCIFLGGKATFFEIDNGDLVALNGVYSDTPNLYYIPKRMLVNNPRLHKSYNLKIDDDCIVVYCTETDVYNWSKNCGGLYSLIAKTATMLADNDLSINVAQKNTRLINILAAEDQQTKDAIDIVVKKQYAGEPYAVVMKSLIDNLQSVPLTSTTSNQYLVQLVELHQYILAHFYEAIGLSTHDNMKKERLITDEINDNDALTKLNIDNMMHTIQNGLDKVNAKYGTDITIKLNPLLAEEPEPASESEPVSESKITPEMIAEGESLLSALKQYEDQQPDEAEQEIEININVTDEAIADIKISDVGGDSNAPDNSSPPMEGDTGNVED